MRYKQDVFSLSVSEQEKNGGGNQTEQVVKVIKSCMATDHYPVCQNKQAEIKHITQQHKGASLWTRVTN